QLLAGLPAARLVADRYLVGADPPAQQLPGDLRLHAESGRLHPEVTVKLGRNQLEARLQVRDVAVEQDIRPGGDALVAEDVQVGVSVVAPERPGPVHYGGVPLDDWLQQRRDLRGGVLQVGVADDDIVASGHLGGGPDRGTLALVTLVQPHDNLRINGQGGV